MEKTSALYLLLAPILLGLVTLVGAVDVTFFSSTSACSGSGYTVGGAGASICYSANAGSVLIQYAGNCQLCAVYRNGACTSNVYQGRGSICVVGGGFTGFAYNNVCRRRSLLVAGEIDIQSQQDHITPTSVVFSEDSAKGKWVLKNSSANWAELFAQLSSLPDAEKLSWMKSQGATYVSEPSAALPIASIP